MEQQISEYPGDQVCLGDLAVRGNSVFCLIINFTFIGLRRAYRLGRGFEVKLSNGGQATKEWDHFYEGS